MKKLLAILILVSMLLNISLSLADNFEWVEEDFNFYDLNGNILLKPTAANYYIRTDNLNEAQTYRGLKLGDYADKVKDIYSCLTDADWVIFDNNSENGSSDRLKKLTNDWYDKNYNGMDILNNNDFLTAKNYSYCLTLSIFKENNHFITNSQFEYSDLDKSLLENIEIPEESREAYYQIGFTDEQIIEQEKLIIYNKYKWKRQRGTLTIIINNGLVEELRWYDVYYKDLKKVYNDDGSINEDYAYILDLK